MRSCIVSKLTTSAIRNAFSPRIAVCALFPAALLAFMLVMGYRVSVLEEPAFTVPSVLLIVVLTALFDLVIAMLWMLLEARVPVRSHVRSQLGAKAVVAATAVVFACWIPVLLAGYPGFFTYDSGTGYLMQWQQISSGELNAHHPILHTGYMALFLKGALALTGDFNAGVFASVLVQAVLVAAALGFSLSWLARRSIGRVGFILSVAYYALDPIIGLFVFSTTKDVFFSAAFFSYCLAAADLYRRFVIGGEPPHLRAFVPLATFGFFAFALRMNALVAIVVIFPVLLVLFKTARRQFVVATVCSLVAVALVLGPISMLLGVQKSPISYWNALGIPMQQIARCTVDDAVSDQDKQLIEAELPNIRYQQNLSDVARAAFTSTDTPKTDLLSLYIHLGVTYPDVFWAAALLQSEDAWSPFCVIDCYGFDDPSTSAVFALAWQEPAHSDSKLPALLDGLRWISEDRGIESIPVVGLIVSIAFYLFVVAFALFKAIAVRNWEAVCLLFPLAVLALTNLLGPCMLIRYFFYLFLALPVMLFTVVHPGCLGGKQAAIPKAGS